MNKKMHHNNVIKCVDTQLEIQLVRTREDIGVPLFCINCRRLFKLVEFGVTINIIDRRKVRANKKF